MSYGGDEPPSTGKSDIGEYIDSERDDYDEKKYRLTAQSSKNIPKSKTVVPKITPPKTVAKYPPISKDPIHIDSKIEFESYSRHFMEGGEIVEVNKIVSIVKQAGVTSYSIKILGNVGTGVEGWKGNDYLPWNSTHKSYGSLALKRANDIKQKLVEAGLDPSKITTALGSPEKAQSADYYIKLNQ